MDLLLTLFVLVIVGGLLWYLVNLLPLAPPLKQIAQVILILFAVIYLLALLFGGPGHFPVIRVQ